MIGMNKQAYYHDEWGHLYTREQWIDIFEYQLTHGFLKDHLDVLCPDGVRLYCAQMFEQQLKDKELFYYGIVELCDEIQ